MIQPIKIKTPRGERFIGPGHPVFIIAELSANHQQRYDNAVALIDTAVEAGVDAVKLQTYTPDTMTIDSDKEWFRVNVNDAWKGQTLYQLYQKSCTPWEWQPKLKSYAESKGILCFSTPFDPTAVDFLELMNVALHKIASFEIVDIPLLKKIGATKKPVIMSRGMASIEEINEALTALRSSGCPAIALLHCISSYPAKPEEMNLNTIPDIANRFQVVTGISDHCLDSTIDVAAVVLGASIIEKHFTISRADGGPDAAFSLEPNELRELVRQIRLAELALGTVTYEVGNAEAENKQFQRSLFAVKDIKKGDVFTTDNIRSIRPAAGLRPKYYEIILGTRAGQDIERGTPLSRHLVEGGNSFHFSQS